MDWTVRDLRAIAPEAERLGITIVFENHEDFQGAVISSILAQVNHPRIKALYDYGNSQMVGTKLNQCSCTMKIEPLFALALRLAVQWAVGSVQQAKRVFRVN
jgi:hypothetical protein